MLGIKSWKTVNFKVVALQTYSITTETFVGFTNAAANDILRSQETIVQRNENIELADVSNVFKNIL